MAKSPKLIRLEAELDHLIGMYEDSDRQDPELRAAIKKQRKVIKALKDSNQEVA